MLNNKDIKIIFMGSSDFSVPIFLELIKQFNVVGLVTEVDKPAGRKKQIVSPPTKLIAEEHSIPCFQPSSLKNPEFLAKLKNLNADLVVVASYGKILPPAALNLAPNGCINIHPSLLPKYRGASPIQTALLKGEEETGVSIILMDQGMDTGDILAQESCAIDPNDYYLSLSYKLAELSVKLLIKNLPIYLNQCIKLRIQKDDDATYCYQIKKTDGKIDWNKKAQSIHNQLRAFAKWPGAYAMFNKRKLDILRAFPVKLEVQRELKNGEVIMQDSNIYVKCGEDFLQLIEVKVEGKQACKINDFINGYQKFVGSILE